MRSKIDKKSFLLIFCQFLEGPGPPKIAPKWLKSAKKRINIDVQKKHVFQYRCFSIFRGFGLRKPLQNRCFFASFSKTSILCKSLQNTGCAHKNQGSDIKKNEKITKKSIPKRTRKKHRKKTSQKSILASILASQNLSKIDPTSKNIEKKGLRKKAQKKEPWTLGRPTGSQVF